MDDYEQITRLPFDDAIPRSLVPACDWSDVRWQPPNGETDGSRKNNDPVMRGGRSSAQMKNPKISSPAKSN